MFGKKSKDSKEKKKKKSKEKKATSKEASPPMRKPGSRQAADLSLCILGHPMTVDMLISQKAKLKTAVDNFYVTINPIDGNTTDGTLILLDCDFYLCVYDVRSLESLNFLRNQVNLTLAFMTFLTLDSTTDKGIR